VVSANARSWQIRRRNGVTLTFQVVANAVEPRESSLRRNLFAKHDARAALADERKPDRPEMTLVLFAVTPTCLREGLTRAGTSPNSPAVIPSGKSERIGPAPDAGEEMALCEPSHVLGGHVSDVSLVNFAIGYQSCLDKFAQPRGGERIVFVVVGGH
jgi:hypothetical protein